MSVKKIYENALYYALFKLYFDVNLMNNYGLFYPDEYEDLYLVHSIDKMIERIDSSYIINKYLIAQLLNFLIITMNLSLMRFTHPNISSVFFRQNQF